MNAQPTRILLIEPDTAYARRLESALAQAEPGESELRHCLQPDEALRHLEEGAFDIVLLHLSAPDNQVLRDVGRLLEHHSGVPVIVLADAEDETTAAKAADLGVEDFLIKGRMDVLALVRTLRNAIERARTLGRPRMSRQFLHSTLDALSASIAILDEDGAIVAVNAFWRRFADENGLNWHDYGVGRNYFLVEKTADPSLEGYEDASVSSLAIQEVLAGRRDEFWMEYPCHTPQKQRWFTLRATRFHAGGRVYAVVAHENITQRKLAEKAMVEAKEAAEIARSEEEERRCEAERRRQIAESLRDVLSLLNSNRSLDEILQFVAERAELLLDCQAVVVYDLQGESEPAVRVAHGLPLEQAFGLLAPVGEKTLNEAVAQGRPVFIHAEESPQIVGGEASAGASDQPTTELCEVPCQAAMAVPIVERGELYGQILLGYTVPRSFSQEDIELTVVFGDQIALAIENDRLRREVEEAAATAERSRLARDLHDAVTQTLFSASLIAEALPQVWERLPEEGRRGLEELRQLTRGALAEMRTLLLELRPAALTEKPLRELLRHLTEAVASQTRIDVLLTTEGDCPLPPDVRVALYRIAQESLNNVAKHAEAAQVTVDLSCWDKQATLRICDDGLGFDLEAHEGGGLGIGIMNERARKVAAALKIDSRPGHGTEVTVTWEQAED
jgi:signal transduction histidine kinase/DNA-binding NarL/FixJ family response regulator